MKNAFLTFFAAVAITTAVGVAPPVVAQPYGAADGRWDVSRRIDWTQDRINRGRDDGSLDRGEYQRVQTQLRSIRLEKQRLRWDNGGGLDAQAREMLLARLDRLNAEIHWLRHNSEARPW